VLYDCRIVEKHFNRLQSSPSGQLQQQLESSGETVFRVSSVTGDGIQELLHYLGGVVQDERQRKNDELPENEEKPLTENSIWDD